MCASVPRARVFYALLSLTDLCRLWRCAENRSYAEDARLDYEKPMAAFDDQDCSLRSRCQKEPRQLPYTRGSALRELREPTVSIQDNTRGDQIYQRFSKVTLPRGVPYPLPAAESRHEIPTRFRRRRVLARPARSARCAQGPAPVSSLSVRREVRGGRWRSARSSAGQPTILSRGLYLRASTPGASWSRRCLATRGAVTSRSAAADGRTQLMLKIHIRHAVPS